MRIRAMFGVVLIVLWVLFIGFGGPYLVSQASTITVLIAILTGSLLSYLTWWYCRGVMGPWRKVTRHNGEYPR